MKAFNSDLVIIHRTSEDVFKFLSDFRNFTPLMPEQVSNWQATAENCSFTVAGMMNLGLKIIAKEPFEKIVMEGEGKLPFEIGMNAKIKDIAGDSEVKISIEAGLNPFTAMAVQKPLSEFVNVLALKLKEVLEKNIGA